MLGISKFRLVGTHAA